MSVVFHAPPGWPPPPLGWLPPAGWKPPSSWPPAPAGWTFYLELVPAYRRHSILVHPARGTVHPAYLGASGSRAWRMAKSAWGLLNRYALISVPAALIAGVVVCIVLLGMLARGSSAEATRAIQACTSAVQQEALARGLGVDSTGGGRLSSPSMSVSDVSERGAALLAITGLYRSPSGTWSFTCQVSTAGETPSVGLLDLVPLRA